MQRALKGTKLARSRTAKPLERLLLGTGVAAARVAALVDRAPRSRSVEGSSPLLHQGHDCVREVCHASELTARVQLPVQSVLD